MADMILLGAGGYSNCAHCVRIELEDQLSEFTLPSTGKPLSDRDVEALAYLFVDYLWTEYGDSGLYESSKRGVDAADHTQPSAPSGDHFRIEGETVSAVEMYSEIDRALQTNLSDDLSAENIAELSEKVLNHLWKRFGSEPQEDRLRRDVALEPEK